jgi:predicted nuclease with TOPRIM domain
MRDELQARLELLRKEWETGRARMAELERQQAQLGETMLRISGAIQVLEELVSEGVDGEQPENGATPKVEAKEEAQVAGG